MKILWIFFGGSSLYFRFISMHFRVFPYSGARYYRYTDKSRYDLKKIRIAVRFGCIGTLGNLRQVPYISVKSFTFYGKITFLGLISFFDSIKTITKVQFYILKTVPRFYVNKNNYLGKNNQHSLRSLSYHKKMAASDEFSICKNAKGKSSVWQHFGLIKRPGDDSI